jgi:heat shock protein HslJ
VATFRANESYRLQLIWRAQALAVVLPPFHTYFFSTMRLSLLLLSVLGLLLGSCKKEEENSPIQNTRWMLVQVEGTPIAVSSYSAAYSSYIQFNADNKMNGLAPCNSFGGTYTLGNGSQLSVSAQASTRATCAAQSIEDQYLNALPRTVRYELSGQELRLFDATTAEPVLIFRAAE